mgnify:CR=1 FL=1
MTKILATQQNSNRILRFKRKNYIPHQWQFLTSQKEQTALVTGFGGGKTHIFLRKVLWCHINLRNKKGKSNGWVIYPTYALADELFVDEFKLILEASGIKYKYTGHKRIFKTKYGKIRVFQLQKPELMVGSELTFVGFDEFDIEKKDKVVHAYNKAMGRMRGCEFPQLFVVTTPEGYRATHKIFVEDINSSKMLINGSTRDNIHRAKGYVQRLENTYTPQLVQAYIDGKFVNLTSGSVYLYFDRQKCHVDTERKKEDIVYIGQDFNFGGCASSCFVERGNEFHQFFEFRSTDTEEIIKNTKGYFPDSKIEFYPDATGDKSTTNASKSDIAMIREAGFTVHAKNTNPHVQDRISAVNRAFHKGIVRINTKTCPDTTKALEQQAFDPGTGKPEKSNKPYSIDDINDSFGYPIAYRYPILRPVMDVNINFGA